jgi:NADH:ubiquinone oxidoreductase subunit
MGATIGTRLMTWWKGERVGEDQFGNHYYKAKRGHRRWVVYRGRAEASKVPPQWHAWLHYTIDAVPGGDGGGPEWERQHQPNLTGTEHAYHPSGSLLEGGRRAATTADYESWTPK